MAHHREGPSGRVSNGRRRAEDARRERSEFRPRLDWLEDRRLLSNAPADVWSQAVPLALGTTTAGTLAPSGVMDYSVAAAASGRLIVQLQSIGFPARVSLVDAQGQTIVQSDDSATGGTVLDVTVSSGTEFLQVESLGAGGTFHISAQVTPSTAAFQPIASSFLGAAPVAVADVDGDKIPDLIAPDGVRLGLGNGTFQAAPASQPLTSPGYSANAISVVPFGNGLLPEIAVLETSDISTTADLLIFQNQGGGQFTLLKTFCVDPIVTSAAMQVVNFGNGIVDLAIANGASGDVSFFVGNAAGAFTTGPVVDVGPSPFALTTGQFGDGHLDVIVAYQGDDSNDNTPGLSVIQDEGASAFSVVNTIPLPEVPSAIVSADFNDDGFLDLALAVSTSDSSDVMILPGLGNGLFDTTAPKTYAVGGEVASLAVIRGNSAKDSKGNSILDLVTANQISNDVSVLLGNGDGTFQPQLLFAAGDAPAFVVATDINNDDRPDLIVGDLVGSTNGEITLLYGRGDGTFQVPTTNPVGVNPDAEATADLNRDGHIDIITLDENSNDISVLLGNGDGSFQPATAFAAGVDPIAMAVGDFNGDGRLDIAVLDQGDPFNDLAGGGVCLLLGNGDGTFEPPEFISGSPLGNALVAGHFHGGTTLDLAVADDSGNVWVLTGDGKGNFTTPPLSIAPAPPKFGDEIHGQISMVAGDFGNGHDDLAIVSANSNPDSPSGGVNPALTILRGDGHGGFSLAAVYNLPNDAEGGPPVIVAGDFRGKGVLDLAIASESIDGPDTLSVFEALGNCQFTQLPPTTFGPFLTPASITTGQFFGSNLGLAIADSSGNSVSLFKGDGQDGFTLDSQLPISGGEPFVVASGDFTADGLSDVAAAQDGPGSVTVELNQGGGQFTTNSINLDSDDTPVVADLDGDGTLDVTIVDGSGVILFRRGQPGSPGVYDPPITVNVDPVTGQVDPSRDITTVSSAQGTLLASVDEADNAVSLYGYQNGGFHRVASLPTGFIPAQVIAVGLNGGPATDLVIRNAGDHTLTIYQSNGHGGFLPRIDLAIDAGVSDVSLDDLTQDGLPDLVLANQAEGTVAVMLNLGGGRFGPTSIYRAGTGLAAVSGGVESPSSTLVSQEGTLGVAVGSPAPGAPIDVFALNAGSETLGILPDLGNAQFANVSTQPMFGPASVIRAAYLGRNGLLDVATLGPDGVTIWLQNAQGNFLPSKPYFAGLNPTGLTIADANGDNVPDLVVGNAFGDVLVLQGVGDGTFEALVLANRSTFVAVGQQSAGPVLPVAVVSQSSDNIVIKNGLQSPSRLLADRTNGLLVPGAPVFADLNRDGIPDVIVPDSGGNDVRVFLGNRDGTYSPLNNDQGFPVGTDPVSVTAAYLNDNDQGRPDILVADKGSNDIDVLINTPQGDGITFLPGRRIHTGAGPVSAAYADMNHDGIPDLVVSDSVSNDVMLIPGVGGGFFNDSDPTIFALSSSPGPLVLGPFIGPGQDVVTLNPGTDHLTVISGLGTDSASSQVFFSGGVDPVSAVDVPGLNGHDDLVVANREGNVVLLEGSVTGFGGPIFPQNDNLANPTSVALVSVSGSDLQVVGASEDDATAVLHFALSEEAAGTQPGPGETTFGLGPTVTLLPLNESALPLVATLLSPGINLYAGEEATGASQTESAALVALATPGNGFGQALANKSADFGDEEDSSDAVEPGLVAQAAEQSSADAWKRASAGTDEAFDEFRRETAKDRLFEGPPPPRGDSANQARPPERRPTPPLLEGRAGAPSRFALVDAALATLSAPERAPLPGDAAVGTVVAARPVDSALDRASLAMLGGCLLATTRPARVFSREILRKRRVTLERRNQGQPPL